MSQFLDHRGEPRVVITGMGAITPIGNSVAESWESVMVGRSGIDRITRFDTTGLPCKIAGEVKGFNPRDYIPHKEVRRMARASQLAVGATVQALEDAGLGPTVPDPNRSGVIVGTGMGGYDFADIGLSTYRKHGVSRVKPYALIASLTNMPCHHVSHVAQTFGPISTVATACASGTQAIGDGAELIRRGRADLVIAGGVEGIIHESALAGFAAMRGLCATHNDDPGRACRPFTLNRNGFILSEGVGMMILERMDHAVARGARILAEVVGYATSSDAFHIAALDPNGAGAMRAMQWAMEDGKICHDQIDYINAHGTSTPANDITETTAIKKLFGERAFDIPISSTKAIHGHALGGAGGIEAVITVQALVNQVMPPTWNYDVPDPECDLDYIPNQPRPGNIEYALTNSFGLGGQNACLVLRRHTNDHLPLAAD